MQLFANNATASLGASLAAGATSLTVATGAGALFPNPTAPDYFLATLEVTGTTTREIVKVTARSGDVFTIVRAQEGTADQAWTTSDTVSLRLTKATMELLQTELALDGARGVRVVPHVPAALGTWTDGTTTYTAASGLFTLFTTTNGDGHVVGDTAQFNAVNYLTSQIYTGAPTQATEYWNGTAWTALTVGNYQTNNALGYSQLRFTIPGDWAVGGSGTNVPQTTYNIRLRFTTAGTQAVIGALSIATRVDLTANEVIASTTGGLKIATMSLGTIAPDIRVAGPIANGRGQVGTFSANSWVYLWLIYNPTTAVWAGLWDVSATAPGMPSGYTYQLLIGGHRVDANGLLMVSYQLGNTVTYPTGVRDLVAGSATTSTAVTATVPPIATHGEYSGFVSSSSASAQLEVYAEPNAAGGDGRRLIYVNTGGATSNGTGSQFTLPFKVAQTFYYLNNGGTSPSGFVFTLGYTMPGNLS